MKKLVVTEVKIFTDIPNVGPAIARVFRRINIKSPIDLKGKNPYALYRRLCKITGTRYDPCVLDTFMAVVDFMNGARPKPWWSYTKLRKKQYPNL